MWNYIMKRYNMERYIYIIITLWGGGGGEIYIKS